MKNFHFCWTLKYNQTRKVKFDTLTEKETSLKFSKFQYTLVL